MDWMSCSIPEVGCSSRILSIHRAAATTSSMVRQPSFWISAASGRSRAPRKASTACLSAASSSRGCRRLASFAASPASSIIFFEPLFGSFSEAQASSRTERHLSETVMSPCLPPRWHHPQDLRGYCYLWRQLAIGTR